MPRKNHASIQELFSALIVDRCNTTALCYTSKARIQLAQDPSLTLLGHYMYSSRHTEEQQSRKVKHVYIYTQAKWISINTP